jgi:hypothetical protein
MKPCIRSAAFSFGPGFVPGFGPGFGFGFGFGFGIARNATPLVYGFHCLNPFRGFWFQFSSWSRANATPNRRPDLVRNPRHG